MDGLEINLLKASEAALADPPGMVGYRSADLDDSERISDLDQFAIAALSQPATQQGEGS